MKSERRSFLKRMGLGALLPFGAVLGKAEAKSDLMTTGKPISYTLGGYAQEAHFEKCCDVVVFRVSGMRQSDAHIMMFAREEDIRVRYPGREWYCRGYRNGKVVLWPLDRRMSEEGIFLCDRFVYGFDRDDDFNSKRKIGLMNRINHLICRHEKRTEKMVLKTFYVGAGDESWESVNFCRTIKLAELQGVVAWGEVI